MRFEEEKDLGTKGRPAPVRRNGSKTEDTGELRSRRDRLGVMVSGGKIEGHGSGVRSVEAQVHD